MKGIQYVAFEVNIFLLRIMLCDPSKLLPVSVVYSFVLLNSILWYGCTIVCLIINLLEDRIPNSLNIVF